MEKKNKAFKILSILDPLNVNVDSNPDKDHHQFSQNESINDENE